MWTEFPPSRFLIIMVWFGEIEGGYVCRGKR